MHIWSQLNSSEQQALLARPVMAQSSDLKAAVEEILSAVEQQGDQALLALTERFDGVRLERLRLSTQAIDEADTELSPQVKAAIDQAYANIRAFHQTQMPSDVRIETMPGVVCELRYQALDKVGLYIPGGSAPLPSTVLMLGIPAQVAGCRRPILCTPPGKNGKISAEIRYAAKLCGIREIYLVGGAQAIAAMAFGSESIPKVDKIFGPGNSFVTQAKQLVSQLPGGPAIDMPAGPSEVLVIADAKANPDFIAADLLSQAEHGADSQTLLVTDSAELLEAVQAALETQLAQLSRRQIAEQAMQHARFILVANLAEAVMVSNAYAPEHLIVQTESPQTLLDTITSAGSIFIGPWSPESAGDYASGTNHVLPTYGYARNTSSLGLADFMRRYTLQTLSKEGLCALGPAIMALADAEGLDAHRRAVAIRLEQQDA